MLPVMYVSVGAHFAHLDTGVSRDVSYISVTGQVCPGATTERKTGCLGFRCGQSYQSGESEETCGRLGSPASWLQAAHTFCVMCSKRIRVWIQSYALVFAKWNSLTVIGTSLGGD